MRLPSRLRSCSSTLFHAALVAAAAAASASCAGGNPNLPECEDGDDNDGDGLVDQGDPACARGSAVESDDPITDCNNGEDDDDDGLADLEDPGCRDVADDSELDNPTPRCDDGIDNDGDGKTDYPDDPGCFNPLMDSEDDDCPDGPSCPQCANGLDDDDDTKADFPGDGGCSAASDNSERTPDQEACQGLQHMPMTGPGVVNGNLMANGQRQIQSNTCGGAGVEDIYELEVDRPVVMVATTALTGTAVDTTLYVRTRCGDGTTELTCNNNASDATTGSTITVALDPGYYYLVVDGTNVNSAGAYTLSVEYFPGEGSPCDAGECAPGLVCRTLPGAGAETCELPVCGDGRDDDGDLATDYPADPGCDTPDDTDETDDCPSGPNCPACANDVDDDGDSQTDWPDDTTCAAASSVSEACDDADPVLTVTQPVHTGNTTGATNDFASTCGGGTGPDHVWSLNLPVPVLSLDVDLAGTTYDSVHMLKDGSCGATSLACQDGLLIEHGALPAGGYTIIIDGWSTTSAGAYTLAVSGVVAGGEACTSPLFATGVLSCQDGYACDGSVCAPAACNDDVDADGDGLPGFPSDPGCTDPSDGDEADDCPSGPGCPVCANDVDDDGDGATDYPADPNCASASATSETCSDVDPIGLITQPTHTGDTTGAANDSAGSCASSGSPDEVWTLTLPVPVQSLHADTVGTTWDTVLYLKDATCAGADLACNDQGGVASSSAFTTGPLPAGGYALVVDGWVTGNFGPYTLNVSAVVAPGTACDSPLFAAGVLSCGDGSVCDGSVCVGAACGDAIDADGDGLAGYPADPGCTSYADNDETDDCPSGPGCPLCANDVDDDGDGATDHGADTDCVAASFPREWCGEEPDPMPTIAAGTITGTTAGAADNVDPTCGSTGGAELGHYLALPVAVSSLTVDTIGTSFDTLIYIDQASCGGAFLGCDDDSGGSLTSRLTATNVPAGGYVVFVDGYSSSSSGPYTLHVAGTAVAGAACTSPLFAAGVLSCASGETCNGTVCAP